MIDEYAQPDQTHRTSTLTQRKHNMKTGKIEGYAKPKQADVETVKNSEKYKDWYVSLKYDGTRQFLMGTDTGTELHNKRGTNKTRHFPEITKEIALPKGVVLDGETIVTDELHPHGNKNVLQKRDGGKPGGRKSGRKNFKQKMKMKQYSAQFVAFDILRYKGENVRDMPIEKRRELLKTVVEGLGDEVTISKRYDNFNKAWNEVTENKMEGVILKKPESRYPEGRTPTWRKVKNIKDTILTCSQYEEHDKGITVIGEDDHDDNHRFTVNGRVSEQVRQEIEDGDTAEVEVSYLERSKNGKLREPRYKRLVK